VQTHIPGFVARANALRAKGVADVLCVSVNDPYVMRAWAHALDADGKVSRSRSLVPVLRWPRLTHFCR
jgi:peroxiredoxin